MGHTLTLFADRYTPVVPGSIPTGAVDPVEGTPLDFRTPRVIGERVDEPFRQLELCGGYDHNWVINGPVGTLRPAARLEGDKSGVILDLETTLPGVQFYSSNYLDGCPAGKGGAGTPGGMRCAWRPSSTRTLPIIPTFPPVSCGPVRPGSTLRCSASPTNEKNAPETFYRSPGRCTKKCPGRVLPGHRY